MWNALHGVYVRTSHQQAVGAAGAIYQAVPMCWPADSLLRLMLGGNCAAAKE
jgi:hypothetical protein